MTAINRNLDQKWHLFNIKHVNDFLCQGACFKTHLTTNNLAKGGAYTHTIVPILPSPTNRTLIFGFQLWNYWQALSFLLYSTLLSPHVEYYVQFWTLYFEKRINKME